MKTRSGLFICEGSSDQALAEIIETLFLERDLDVRLTVPPFERLTQRISKGLDARVRAALRLTNGKTDLIVIHRDSDNTGRAHRLTEMTTAMAAEAPGTPLLPIIPVRMTEAWLLLDEKEIRQVAGNPKGRARLDLPRGNAIERVADPKTVLRDCLLTASETTGRRRDRQAARFDEQRRQLLASVDPTGPVTGLSAWQSLVSDVDAVCELLSR